MRITNEELRRRIRKILLERQTASMEMQGINPNVFIKFDLPTELQGIVNSSGAYDHKTVSRFVFIPSVAASSSTTTGTPSRVLFRNEAGMPGIGRSKIGKSLSALRTALGPGEIALALLFYTDDSDLRATIATWIQLNGFKVMTDYSGNVYPQLPQLSPNDSGKILDVFPDAPSLNAAQLIEAMKEFNKIQEFGYFCCKSPTDGILGGAGSSGDILASKIPRGRKYANFLKTTAEDNTKQIFLDSSGFTNLYLNDYELKAGDARLGAMGQNAVQNVLTSARSPLALFHKAAADLHTNLLNINTYVLTVSQAGGGGVRQPQNYHASSNGILEAIKIITGYDDNQIANPSGRYFPIHNEFFDQSSQGIRVLMKLSKGAYSGVVLSNLITYFQDASNTIATSGNSTRLFESLSPQGVTASNIRSICDNIIQKIKGAGQLQYHKVFNQIKMLPLVEAIDHVTDEISLTSIPTGGEPLYQLNVMRAIQNHFPDILDLLNQLEALIVNADAENLYERDPLIVVLEMFSSDPNSYMTQYTSHINTTILAKINVMLGIISSNLGLTTNQGILDELSASLRANIKQAFPGDQKLAGIDNNTVKIYDPVVLQKSNVDIVMTDNFALRPKLSQLVDDPGNQVIEIVINIK